MSAICLTCAIPCRNVVSPHACGRGYCGNECRDVFADVHDAGCPECTGVARDPDSAVRGLMMGMAFMHGSDSRDDVESFIRGTRLVNSAVVGFRATRQEHVEEMVECSNLISVLATRACDEGLLQNRDLTLELHKWFNRVRLTEAAARAHPEGVDRDTIADLTVLDMTICMSVLCRDFLSTMRSDDSARHEMTTRYLQACYKRMEDESPPDDSDIGEFFYQTRAFAGHILSHRESTD